MCVVGVDVCSCDRLVVITLEAASLSQGHVSCISSHILQLGSWAYRRFDGATSLVIVSIYTARELVSLDQTLLVARKSSKSTSVVLLWKV